MGRTHQHGTGGQDVYPHHRLGPGGIPSRFSSVRATAVDALQHGFVPLVVRQAVGDRDPGPHESALFDLQAKYAEVADEDSVVSWHGQDTGEPLS
jgi:isochorismate hydrolase